MNNISFHFWLVKDDDTILYAHDLVIIVDDDDDDDDDDDLSLSLGRLSTLAMDFYQRTQNLQSSVAERELSL